VHFSVALLHFSKDLVFVVDSSLLAHELLAILDGVASLAAVDHKVWLDLVFLK